MTGLNYRMEAHSLANGAAEPKELARNAPHVTQEWVP